ncbi:hypothetical protein [Gallaecimonas sp. GXIMD1310]|uniref:hypothetical protein n=1 Tax=Gallaecimonas sp. GXIMD1310 TaxID=3131926 RepID=UPI003251EE2F
MAKKILIALLVTLALTWVLAAVTGHQHYGIYIDGDNLLHSPKGLLFAVLGVAAALLAVGGTLLGVVLLLVFIFGSLFLGLAFAALPIWLPIVIIWLLVRPNRSSAG